MTNSMFYNLQYLNICFGKRKLVNIWYYMYQSFYMLKYTVKLVLYKDHQRDKKMWSFYNGGP